MEIVEELGQLNEMKEIRSVRENGSLRIQKSFENCPSLADQHMAHLSNINWLIKRYTPDEVSQYLAARQVRPEIIGHDFSQEMSLQEAKNVVVKAKRVFSELPDEVRSLFASPLAFIKFIDNPQNADKLVKLGIVDAQRLVDVKDNSIDAIKETTTTTKEEAKV